jgi:hypothetical protein
MHTIGALVLALIVAASAGAAGAPADALVLTRTPSLHLVDRSGAVTASIGGIVTGAAWSPDGTRLAYASETGGANRLFVAAADGSGTRELQVPGVDPAWVGPLVWVSPSEVAVHQRPAGSSSYSLWIVPVDGGDRRVVADPTDLNFALAMQPNGVLLVHTVLTGAGARRAVTDVRSGIATTLPIVAPLVWSPDGRLLAAPTTAGIETLRPDGADRRVIPIAAPGVSELAWSPDGSRIAFTSRRSYPELSGRGGTPFRSDVYSVAVDGSDLRRLTSVGGDDLGNGGSAGSAEATWWPDGTRLFFKRAGQDAALVMNADGSCETRWPGPSAFRSPLWRPGAAHAAGRIDCSSVIVRLRTPLAEVSHRAALPLTIVVRNDGTRTLRGAWVSLAATQGTVSLPGRPRCGSGPQLVCPLEDLEPGAEVTLQGQATFTGPGRTNVTATAWYADGGDADPGDDQASVLRDVSPCDVLGTWGRDRLIGTVRGEWICGRPGWDYLDGRGGADLLESGGGNDTVIAGPGRDVVRGAGGADTIRVRDGERDVVDCGTEQDLVFADRKDVLRHCERIRRR